MKYSKENLQLIASGSKSLREMLAKLSITSNGSGGYKFIKSHILNQHIDISHWGNNNVIRATKSLKSGQKSLQYNLEDYLSNRVEIKSSNLKIKLLQEGVLTKECNCCKLTMWLDQPILLQLDHIDGNNKNNNLSNLRLLCTNCHIQTPTWGNKKRKES